MFKILKYSKDFNLQGTVAIPDAAEDREALVDDVEDEIIKEEELPSPQEIAELQAEKIREEARRYYDDMIAKAHAESDAMRARAQEEGYQQAFTAHTSDIEKALYETCTILQKVQSAYEEYTDEYTKKLSDFSLEIAAQIMRTKIEIEPIVMCNLVTNAVASVKDAKWVVVNLSKELSTLVEFLEKELVYACPTIENLQIKTSNIPIERCVISSSKGIIDASVKEQIENLARRFAHIREERGKS